MAVQAEGRTVKRERKATLQGSPAVSPRGTSDAVCLSPSLPHGQAPGGRQDWQCVHPTSRAAPPPAADLRCPLHRRAHRGVVAAISASTAPAQPRYLIRAPRAATSDSPIAIGVPRPRESGRAACCLSGRLQMEAKRLRCALCRSRCSGLHVVTALWERAQPSLGLGRPGNAGAALGLRSAPPESSVSPGRGLKGCCRAVMRTQSEDMAHQGRPWG